jgi:hypothetical protein
MPLPTFKSVYLEIDRATEHIAEINKLIRESPPFSYVLETHTKTRQRSTFAKKNETVIDRIGVISGEAVHALHTAIDHAYWEIVSPFATKPGHEMQIQFPFHETSNGFDEAVKNRLAHRVSPGFEAAIRGLKAHGEPGGNILLYLIAKIDGPRKHRTLTPMGDYKRIHFADLRQQVPDFPPFSGEAHFGQNRRDVVWPWDGVSDIGHAVGVPRRPFRHIFEKQLDVPVDVVFVIGSPNYGGPVIPTLNKLVEVTQDTVSIMKSAA